ncbi:hypothetical protein TNCV_413471 [Trichonephila clavipes]|nr:hypothetical protein TNCV_413471 [Trichonephila clavipes]
MSSHSSCRTALKVRILNVWIDRHDLRTLTFSEIFSQSHRACIMGGALSIKADRVFLGRRLAARTLPPVTIRELRLALRDEWAAMPQQLIDTLILSMGRRS